MGDVDVARSGIDLAAPLLSVRRHGGTGGTGAGTGKLLCREPDGDDAVPGSGAAAAYGWDHRPGPAGHPKSVRTRRARPPLPPAQGEGAVLVASSVPVPEVATAARFSDAFSRADSCFTVDCSATGLSDAGAQTGAPGARGGSVMMDRFLWAAKAVAVGGLPHHQQTFRKAGASAQETARPAPANAHISDGYSLLPRRFHVELERTPANHEPSSYTKEDKTNDDDDGDGDGGSEWDAHSTAGFASRRCGLLPTRCVNVKTALQLLLLNPAQAMKRSRGGARRFLPGRGVGGQGDTNPLLRPPRKEDQLEHDGPTQQTWEEVYINSLLLRSDRRCMKPATTMASELGRTVRALYTNKGEGVHPKATHLGLLLVLDRSDDSEKPSPLVPTKCSGPANGFPPPLEEKTTASHDIVPWTEPALTLPKPKSPSESWLSRALPSVSTKPPATSFLGIHLKQAPSPWCSSDQAADHARPQQIRIQDLQK